MLRVYFSLLLEIRGKLTMTHTLIQLKHQVLLYQVDIKDL